MTNGHQRQSSAWEPTLGSKAFHCIPFALLLFVGGCISVSQFKRDGGIRLMSHEQPIPEIRDPVTFSPPSYSAESTIATATKTAVDMVVELEAELDNIRRENRHLRKSLRLAENTIEDQHESIAQAAVELNKSRLDFERLQAEMKDWRDKFTRLSQQTAVERRSFDQAFRRMEQRLQAMLIQYADGPTAPSPENEAL